MDAMTEDTRLPADIDATPLVRAAIALLPEVRRYHEEIEREQRLPPALLDSCMKPGSTAWCCRARWVDCRLIR